MEAIRHIDERGQDRQRARRIGDPQDDVQREIVRLREKLETMQAENAQLKQDSAQAQTAIQPVQQEITLQPQMTVEDFLERDRFIRETIDNVLIPGIDYGPPFPHAKENALKKSGAEKFMAIFELRPDYIEIEKVVERAIDSVATAHIRYEYRCNLHLRSLSGPIVGAAIGVCSSEEDRYKYRKMVQTCPECGAEAIYRSKFPDKDTNEKGWYCWKKEGGCGANFVHDDERITSQEVGKKLNPDVMGLQHTVSAMAQKRAFVLALRTTTGLSAYFSEMVPDEDGGQRTTINSTATVKTTASIASELIEFAEPLLPEGHGFTRNQIGAACLKALEMDDWASDYEGSIDDAKKAIAASINEKFGNGEPAQKSAPEAPQGDSSGDTPPQETPPQEAAKPARITDTPDEEHKPPKWAVELKDVHQFVNGYREFRKGVNGIMPNYGIARAHLIEALGLQGKAQNNEELQALILAQYNGEYGDAVQAYTLYEFQAEGDDQK